MTRQSDRRPVHLLQAVAEHGAIDFVQHLLVDLDTEVRTDAEQELVVRAVVDTAERESVRHHRQAALVRVVDDVSGVEQAAMLESTDAASILVGVQDAAAELSLVQAYTLVAACVAA